MDMEHKVLVAFEGNGESVYPTIINRKGEPTLVVRDELMDIATHLNDIGGDSYISLTNHHGERVVIDIDPIVDCYDTRAFIANLKDKQAQIEHGVGDNPGQEEG